MNRFVANQFEMILKRDYGFNPKIKETSRGMEFTITVADPNLRRFLTELTHPKTIGVEERIDRETGTRYKAPIIKNVTFIRTVDIMDPDCKDLSFCLDAKGDTGAVKINVIEHNLRVFMTNKPDSKIAI